MSTIVTRKSLALGAIVALATTAFAGTPAHAAGEIVVAPSAGTSYSTLITDAFTLETSFAPGVVNGNSQLKYQIKTAKASTVRALAGTSAPSASSIGSAPATADATGDASDPTAFVQYVSGTATQTTQRNFLGFKLDGVTYTSDSVDVVVTAFVDSNNDGLLTAGEWATAKTVSFKKYADVTSTIVLDEPKVGDNKIVGHVTLAGLNQSQVQSAVKLQFRKTATTSLDGLDANVGASGAFGGVTALSTDAGDYKATTASVDTLDSTDTVELTAIVGSSSVSVGTKVVKTATDRTISKFEATVDATDNGNASNYARTNSEFSTTAVVYSAATTPAAIAGVAVSASVVSSRTVWSTDAAEAQSVTLNGTKYTTYATLAAAVAALTSDASGKVTVKLVPVNFVSGDTFDIKFAAQNLSKTVRATLSDAAYTVTDDASATYRKIEKNTSATLNYTVKDQFKVLASATNLRLQLTSSLGVKYAPVVAGKATYVVTPTKDSTDAIAVAQELQASATATNGNVTWTATASAGQLSAARNIVISAVADSFDTTPVLATVNGASWTSSSTAKQALATGDATDTAPNSATITGSVVTQGQYVTIAGSGLRFVIGGTAYTDTVTVPVAASTGDFTVNVASVKSGAQVVTLTTGSVSKTVSITFATAVISQLKNTVVAAPTQAQAGRAVNITATLTDANGNAVAGKTVKFAVSGVGTLSSSDAVTDASGVATVRLVSSYGEDGDSVVTVSHNGSDEVADTSATTTPNDFTLVKTVTFGLTDASIDNVNNRVTAVASYSKGKTVGFYVDGVKKWSKVSTSDADVVVNYNLKKGRHTVTVKISGGLVTSEVIVVQ
jgi:hypothetical protein